MSWFPSSNIASLAKNALKEAQKTIDKALDIKDDTGGNGINTTVSSVADVATDFFSSWGVNVGSKPTPSKIIEKSVTNESTPAVVTTAPTSTKIDKSPTTSSLPNVVSDVDNDAVTLLKRSLTTTDVSCELIAPNDDVPHFIEDEEKESNKFQSLWLDGSDSFESSIETSSTSIIEVLDSSNLAKDIGMTVLHPKPLLVQVQSIPNLGPTLEEVKSTQIVSSPSTPVSTDFDSQLKPQDMPDEEAPHFQAVPLESTLEESLCSLAYEQQNLVSLIALEHDGTDLDSSTATTVEPEPEPETDEVELIPNLPNLPPSSSQETLECDVEEARISSNVSISSRATSSISVISEEKDPSSPQISPSSQHNLADSEDSPSFEVISIHHHGSRKSDSNSSFDFLGSSSSQHCPSQTSSVSVIPSLQSTPDRGTPLTHSRSNSNTSSSFDKIDDSNTRLKCPHHFLSSTSSSDIEVIPLDSVSVENFNLFQRKRKSLAEVETQTMDPWPEKTETKERVVEIIPVKISAALAEKDFEILQLREEGEKLSKKQFELSTAIKKLRQKEKDTDSTVKSLKNDLAAKNVEIERFTKTFIAKEAQDQTQSETIGKLNSENRKLLNTVAQLRSELEDSKENASSMKASVEDASVEILELQNAISSVQRDTAQLDNLTRLNGELTNRSESLQKEVEQLRHSINSSQLKSTARESELKTQILNLTHQIHSLENELSNNSSEIADVTMPLSLEIEKLQQEVKSKAHTFERREVHLLNKVAELELKVKSQVETEKLFKSSQFLLQNSLAILEQENENLKDEKTTLSYQLTTQIALRNENLQKLTKLSALEHINQELEAQVSSLQKEKEGLKAELKNERVSLQTETKRTQMLSEQLKLSNSQATERMSTSSTSGTKLEESRNTSPRSFMSEASYLDDVLDPNGQNPCMTPKSFFDSFSSVNYIENLQGHLRQKELELIQLHDEVSKNEKIRKTLNEEIAHLTVNNQELLQRIERLGGLQQRLTEMDKNYNAVLQMYGEKVEEADELRMDLQDVKEMYKIQIEQLLKKS